ncbi:cytochrome P450 6k1-like [Prorops nasuta]|uniref:cytochrome P450 6k1-like n=1 Tax=Prorops nasuta TaxID=863751 RepID=UPI0034CEFD53
MIVEVACIFLALFGLFYSWSRYKHSYWKRKGVRSLPTHWLFGNFKDAIYLKTSPGLALGDLHNQTLPEDDLLGVYIFQKPFLLIRSPEIMKHILVRDFNNFKDRYFTINNKNDLVGSTNLFAIHNPEWKYLRMKMSPVFSSGKVKKLLNLMLENADTLEKHLEEKLSDGKMKPIIIKDTFRKFTTDVISSIAFGIKTNSFSDPEPNFYTYSQAPFTQSTWQAILFFTFFFFPNLGSYFNRGMLGSSTEYFRNLFKDSMENHEKFGVKRGDLIDYLVELKNDKQEADFKFEGDVLLAQSTIFFVAGLESSTSTICFALCELAKNPKIQDKVREEIQETIENKGLNYESIQEMKYLLQTIKETLRLYPVAPLLDRVAADDYKIPGKDVVIEKGTPVYVALAGIHMDPRYFPNPEKFDPNRFSDTNHLDSCTYLPFGEGPRSCIGARVGTLQTAVGILTIIRKYEVSMDFHNEEISDARSIFLAPPDNYTLIFKKLE